MSIQQRLRSASIHLRDNSMPLKDLIPLLQQAADKLDALEKKNNEYSWQTNPDRMGQ